MNEHGNTIATHRTLYNSQQLFFFWPKIWQHGKWVYTFKNTWKEFYIHGSMHRELSLITVQQDATVFTLLYFCGQLYLFRTLTPNVRSWYSCNYSFWYWLTGPTAISSRCWFPTQQRERLVVDLVNQYQSCIYSCTSSWWWVSTPETCRAAYRNVINWISPILLDNYYIHETTCKCYHHIVVYVRYIEIRV